MECCRTTNPSIYSSEIQIKLAKNDLQCLCKNVPPQALISCSATEDLGLYSVKKFRIISQQSLALENENVHVLFKYLAACIGGAFL